MPVIFYPPNMPLRGPVVYHRQDLEPLWASPIPFLPFLLLTTVIFILGLWGVSVADSWPFVGALSPLHRLLVVSSIPPLVLVLLLFMVPQMSSPAPAYRSALAMDPSDRTLRWNLAVAATAHIYCGELAQFEWLHLMTQLSAEDRFIALGYIKQARSRLQQIPVLAGRDIVIALLVCGGTYLVSVYGFHYPAFDATFHSLTLVIGIQLFMLYLFIQRWQHIRRLMELEDVFEELLPARPAPTPASTVEDEVARWHREQEARQHGPQNKVKSVLENPPVPWE